MENELFSPEALILSLIGMIPVIGDISKDQISAYMAKCEAERMRELLDRMRNVINIRLNRKINRSEIPDIIETIMVGLDNVKNESNSKKRNLMASIIGGAIALNYEQSKIQWFVVAIKN